MYPDITSDILIFKTNILHQSDVDRISLVLNSDKRIRKWNVDIGDVDHVLRVEAEEVSDTEIINLLNGNGFQCEPLPD